MLRSNKYIDYVHSIIKFGWLLQFSPSVAKFFIPVKTAKETQRCWMVKYLLSQREFCENQRVRNYYQECLRCWEFYLRFTQSCCFRLNHCRILKLQVQLSVGGIYEKKFKYDLCCDENWVGWTLRDSLCLAQVLINFSNFPAHVAWMIEPEIFCCAEKLF